MIGSIHTSTGAQASQSLHADMNQAIYGMNLRKLGWRGFEALDWVKEITGKYPDAPEIAHTCSSHRPGYMDQVKELFAGAEPADRKPLHRFFLGKLGLEELSCQMNGAAAAACDKRAAFLEICAWTKAFTRS